MKALLEKGKSFVGWGRNRPLRTLIIILAIETFVFLSLLVFFIWAVATR